MVREGRIIAFITDLFKKKEIMLPHLHISIAWVPESISHEQLNWKVMSNPEVITLLNPIDFIAHKYTVLAQERLEVIG